MAESKVNKRNTIQYEMVPYKIALCQDWGLGTQIVQDYYDAMRLGFEEAAASKLIDRPVNLVIREVEGTPTARIFKVIQAWRALAQQELPMAIVGPHRSDAAQALREEISASSAPTISHCGTLDFGGPFNISLGNGTFADEGPILADFHRRHGHAVGVVRELDLAGSETSEAFRAAAHELNVKVISDQTIDSCDSIEAVTEKVRLLRAAGATAVQYLGGGGNARTVVTAVNRIAADGQWSVTKVLNIAFVLRNPGFGAAGIPTAELEGWIGLDQVHERNKIFSALLDRFEKKYGRRPFHCYTALGWDTANVLAIATARSKPHWREGFKGGLEKVRWLPSAVGGPASFISIGPFDHRGYKGNFITLREIRGGADRLVGTPTLLTE
ncbi:MAG: ABC transporter substrate-binding protein [Steroidobacteraceae bacterium]